MLKRKQTHDTEVDDEGSEEQTPDLVDVNFDYYNVNASNDYHAIQRLFIQLFGPDAKHVQTGPLTDLVTTVAEESGVGSTIKTEEEEGSDPYAVLTVISCRDHASLQTSIEYLLSKTSGDEGFHSTLSSLLDNRTDYHVGLVLSERLINMPVQVMAPMYRMLSEEIEEAVRDGHAYRFTHYLFVSRVYRLTAEEEEAMLASQRRSKRHRSTSDPLSNGGVYGFHPEDEVILQVRVFDGDVKQHGQVVQHATHAVTYDYTNREDVGLDVAGRAMLVPAANFRALVSSIEDVYRSIM